jgi:plastocyanin
MTTSSVLLDPPTWQTGTTHAAARFSRGPVVKEAHPLRSARNILVMLAVGAALAAGCTGDGGNEVAGGAASSGDRAEPTSSRGSAAGDGDTDRVQIANFAFAPATVRAKVGQRVRWEHQDPGVTHTVTALDGQFRSRELREGGEFSHRFRTAGTFAYRCAIHPDMRGTVRVG